MSGVSHGMDRVDVVFDDPNLVSNAGLLVVATLADRLGIGQLVDRWVMLGNRAGSANPGAKFLTLVLTLVAGGSHIDHVDMLRAGDTRRILPFRVAAPSTVGTFLRSFTWGHVCQLARVSAETLKRAWSQPGAGPGESLVIDVDSTVCETYGTQKQGTGYGHTSQNGYHPLLAVRADTAEVVHGRLRRGGSQRGHTHFIAETIRRVRRAGAVGAILLRADSGFWSYQTIRALNDLAVAYSITVNQTKPIVTTISQIPDNAWIPADATPSGQPAQVASIGYQVAGRYRKGQEPISVTLIVRRVATAGHQTRLFNDAHWEYRVFATNRTETDLALIDRQHRHHALVELAIRDLKAGAGLNHLPSGNFAANAAWLQAVILAHNLTHWTQTPTPGQPRLTNTTIRTRLINIAGRVVNHAGQLTLRLPTHWPWANQFQTLLTRIRNLPQPT